MARIAGVDLPNNKRVEIGLTYIYGISYAKSDEIIKKASVSPETKIKDLTEDEIVRIREVIKDYKIEGDLRRDVSLDIKRLVDIGTYRGRRHRNNLPVRGQRSKTNARTRRGKRKTVGSGRKKEEKK